MSASIEVTVASLASRPPVAIRDCLADAELHDPLMVPVDRATVLRSEGVAASDAGGSILGLGWWMPAGDATQVDVCVRPASRRHGIGSALMGAVGRAARGRLRASCDAGHDRAVRFLIGHGFEAEGVIFHQRWDGGPSDVPAAFRSATLGDARDRRAAWRLLGEAARGAWPPLAPALEPVEARESVRVREAWIESRRVGVVFATEAAEALSIIGLAVLPAWRGRGVGRALLCDAMAHAAATKRGVTLRVGQGFEPYLRATQSLGFWTFRSWAVFGRG